MVLLMSFVTKSQRADHAPVLTKEDYLLKSRNQRTAAIVIEGLGAGMLLAGGQVAIDDIGGIGDPEDVDNSTLSTVLTFGGIALVFVSAPLSFSSRKNLKKAAKFSIQPQTLNSIENGTVIISNGAII